MDTTCWILGASDPEMERIEALLMQTKCHFVYATANGRRVHPGNAYKANHSIIPEGSTVYAVECGWEGETADVFHIDHHRPGDPGFGRPPAEFFDASSIGQVFRVLAADATPPHEMVLVAAADHCLGAAYRGECPGVDPDELMEWRAVSRAKFQGRVVDDILADVASAQQALRQADFLRFAPGVYVRDMRRDKPVPELPEAAMRMGASYISGPLVGSDGRAKFTASGSPATVRAFIEVYAPKQGLVDVYGDPARGFAGGYVPPTWHPHPRMKREPDFDDEELAKLGTAALFIEYLEAHPGAKEEALSYATGRSLEDRRAAANRLLEVARRLQ